MIKIKSVFVRVGVAFLSFFVLLFSLCLVISVLCGVRFAMVQQVLVLNCYEKEIREREREK